MSKNKIVEFTEILKKNLNSSSFVSLSIKNKRNKMNELKTVTAKLIEIKEGVKLSFVYRYPTKDITKNLGFDEGVSLVNQLLTEDFLQADLFTLNGDYYFSFNNKNISTLKRKDASTIILPKLTHDIEKNRMISTVNNIYLRELGITSADWQVKKTMQDKFRQINKYIEIIDGVIKNTNIKEKFNIVDMGSGKGYLTFALYDYLYNVSGKKPNVVGVELRNELVTDCNRIAQMAGFSNLGFKAGTIKDIDLPKTDMLIALHACDTATDDAIYRGISSESEIIIVAPCCHKQLRKELNPANELNMITKYGILKERQAEILTDGIRALLLEAYGYKTKVFEFIATEHTPKNVLIVAVKRKQLNVPDIIFLEKITNLKQIHGIGTHYLETLLKANID